MESKTMPSDSVNSLEEANIATLENGKVLRVQPRAPAPTRYYYPENGSWKKKIAGKKYASEVSVEKVRKTIQKHIKKNSNPGGGGVRAVDPDRMY